MPETAIVYTRWFDPQNVSQTAGPASTRVAAGDRVDVPVYIYDEQIIRAVNVAGVTGSPLLVEGPSGCGKSSLAEHVAHTMDWDYYRYTVTSRTQAGDLLYRIDQLKRQGILAYCIRFDCHGVWCRLTLDWSLSSAGKMRLSCLSPM